MYGFAPYRICLRRFTALSRQKRTADTPLRYEKPGNIHGLESGHFVPSQEKRSADRQRLPEQNQAMKQKKPARRPASDAKIRSFVRERGDMKQRKRSAEPVRRNPTGYPIDAIDG